MFGYLLNIVYISIFYHRGLAHSAFEMKPSVKEFIQKTGVWVTGIDPKTWIAMHRKHHEFSDTKNDPHSPVNCKNPIDMFMVQYKSYARMMVRLIKKDPIASATVENIGFDVQPIMVKGLWYFPYLLQLCISIIIGVLVHPIIGISYWFGMMSHPVQGWMVNFYGHHSGYQTFDLNDNSKNNIIVGVLTMGEGFQNNHHKYPNSAKFSILSKEIDLGYYMCIMARSIGLISNIQVAEATVDLKKMKLV
jgi:stearoyl-CoA desaturase (delta-9 desaturase)